MRWEWQLIPVGIESNAMLYIGQNNQYYGAFDVEFGWLGRGVFGLVENTFVRDPPIYFEMRLPEA